MIKDLGGGVGHIVCGDCDGTGLFLFIPEPHLNPQPCVRCKATGKVFIMFYNKEKVTL